MSNDTDNNDNEFVKQTKETQITIKLTNEEKDIIKRAARIISLGHSSFSRMATLKEAKTIIKNLKEDIQ